MPQIVQAGLGLPDRDYYLVADDAKFKDARASYARLPRPACSSSRARPATRRRRREAVLALETALAQGQWARVENRDPVKTYNPGRARRPGAARAGIRLAGVARRHRPRRQDRRRDRPASRATWRPSPRSCRRRRCRSGRPTCARHLLGSYASYLAKDFVDARFAFVGTTLSGTTENLPRWKRGVGLVEASVGRSRSASSTSTSLLPAGVEGAHGKAGRQPARGLPREHRRARLDEPGDEEGGAGQAREVQRRRSATRSAGSTTARSRSSAATWSATSMRARAFEYARDLAKLGKPVDRDEWGMTPQTVNAYYNPSLNEIVFPAAILQPPFFDPDADDAVNYGAHRRGHRPRDQPRLRRRGQPVRRRRQPARLVDRRGPQALRGQDQDAGRAVLGVRRRCPGYHVNGELTLGENIADNCRASQIAYKAYQLLARRQAGAGDRRHQRRRSASSTASRRRGAARRATRRCSTQIKSDPHSPDEFRVNGAVRNHAGVLRGLRRQAGRHDVPAARAARLDLVAAPAGRRRATTIAG